MFIYDHGNLTKISTDMESVFSDDKALMHKHHMPNYFL